MFLGYDLISCIRVWPGLEGKIGVIVGCWCWFWLRDDEVVATDVPPFALCVYM